MSIIVNQISTIEIDLHEQTNLPSMFCKLMNKGTEG